MPIQTINRVEIAAASALEMVAQCVDYATRKNWEICAAICDPRGHLVALARTDNVVTPAIQYAIDKAWTAATLSTTTEAFHTRASENPALALGLTNRERVLVFPGGFPIYAAQSCLGGLGVSGAKDDEDIEVAQTIIDQNELSWTLP